MRDVNVDTENKLAIIQAGARIKDVHTAIYAKGFCGGIFGLT